MDEDSSSGRSVSGILPVHRRKRHCGGCETEKDRDTKKCAKYLHGDKPEVPSNALVQLQARYNYCGEAASEKCLSAATFVR